MGTQQQARIAVFISGHGTNLQAIIDRVNDGYIPNAQVCLVVSNRRDAYGLVRAQQAGIPTEYFPLYPYRKAGKPRTEYDADLAVLTAKYKPDWIVCAGWMHILSNAFQQHFPHRVINLHPALPGTLPGTDSIARAFEAYQRGELKESGCMVHYAPDEGVDVGPVILQRIVPIYPTDTLDTFEERMHAAEHQILPDALRLLLTEVTKQ